MMETSDADSRRLPLVISNPALLFSKPPMMPPLRVCAFESRRQNEMAGLIERAGGLPTIAPSLREIPLDDNAAVFHFAEELLAGKLDGVIFMTGMGTELLFAALELQGTRETVRTALSDVLIMARGPKPAAALSKLRIRVDIKAPEPNTWQDMVQEMQRRQVELSGRRFAIQEYGEPSRDLYDWLTARQAAILPVPVYRWSLPEDLQPLEAAIRATIAGEFDVLLWTSAQQMNHVLEVAGRMGVQQNWLQAAQNCMIGSIGPTASERLATLGLPADLQPSHPKMAHLIRESLEAAPDILQKKRGRSSPTG
jgi:uroporphyrinogen-III synthase